MLLPVPCPNLYIQLNGLTLTVDPVSLLWGNLFCLDLYRSLEQFKAIYKLEDPRGKDEHLDIRLDAFWLKVGTEPDWVTCWWHSYISSKAVNRSPAVVTRQKPGDWPQMPRACWRGLNHVPFSL